MKKILTLVFVSALFSALAQETTVTLIGINTIAIDTLICEGDTLTKAYYKEEMKVTDWGADLPKDTTVVKSLIRNGSCPADSLEVIRQLFRDALEIQNRAAHTMNLSFDRVRRSAPEYQGIRDVYNRFSGSDLYFANEDRFASAYDSVMFLVVDVTAGTSVQATMRRLGVLNRYRLEVNEGQLGAGTRFVVIPLSTRSFVIVYGGKTYTMYMDEGVDSRFPIFRHAGYLEGEDEIRIIRIK
jgi:hypothetical protein